jgi:cell division topological specificity factor
MTLLAFINRLLGRQKPSATMARERLQLVLAHDRSDLNPELLDQMRREILAVVQRYVEIDIESGDVSLETEDRVTALVANLPIRRARPQPLPAPPSSEAAESTVELPSPSAGHPPAGETIERAAEGDQPNAAVAGAQPED